MHRFSALLLLLLAIPASLAGTARASCPAPDSLYAAHHPRLLFETEDIAMLRARVNGSGPAADAFAFMEQMTDGLYLQYPLFLQTGEWYGLEVLPHLGLVGHLREPVDTAALTAGRDITVNIANGFSPDLDEAHSGMRLRALAVGYDLFFADAPDSLRCIVRTEMEAYMTLMTSSLAYAVFEYPPYLANHSAMFGAALGLAAICLWDETDPALAANALAMCDRIVDALASRMIDAKGAYHEGAFYATWTMRQLVYYFEARRRFDGTDYAQHPRVRALERWLACEVLPEGDARSLNLNDSSWHSRPLAYYPTYFEWAMSRWNSGLSSWLHERLVGQYGYDWGNSADKTSVVLWYQALPGVQPGTVLPPRTLFPGVGLYHFRTGWQEQASSDDVVFAFHSGRFEGGHQQEDQNGFVLHGYGGRFVVDHGSGVSESEAHNMVFIDGAGQHNAGHSIGTDGEIVEHMITGFADFLMGDATRAYTTYSAYNAPDQPLPGTDWSWGYKGANPVEFAHRRVLAVDDGTVPPWFAVMDDIRKDGAPHNYTWRLHTADSNNVDVSAAPFEITAPNGSFMHIHPLRPSDYGVSTIPFDNGTPEPDATVIRVSTTAVEPNFAFLLMPFPSGATPAAVTTTPAAWGFAAQIASGATSDVLIRNESGGTVSTHGITTDADVCVVRRVSGTPVAYLASDMTTLTINGTLFAEILDGAAGCALAGATLTIDRYDAQFRFLDTGATELRYGEQNLGLAGDGNGYLVSDAVTAAPRPTPLVATPIVRIYPNPFNPTTIIEVRAARGEHVSVDVYDVRGRHVRTLHNGPARSEALHLVWNGTGVATGTYFVVVKTPRDRGVAKAVMLK